MPPLITVSIPQTCQNERNTPKTEDKEASFYLSLYSRQAVPNAIKQRIIPFLLYKIHVMVLILNRPTGTIQKQYQNIINHEEMLQLFIQILLNLKFSCVLII